MYLSDLSEARIDLAVELSSNSYFDKIRFLEQELDGIRNIIENSNDKQVIVDKIVKKLTTN